MNRRPTIVDVARAAGVSKSTVSLVLKDSPLVRPDTRTLIRRTMTDLGYVYNRNAATLRGQSVGLVGLVINDLRNPFFTEFATSAQMAFSAAGYATVVANTDEDPRLQVQVVASMIEHSVSALVISPTYGEEEATFGPLRTAGIPVIQVLRSVGEDAERFPFASFAFTEGSAEATRHLMAGGPGGVAFVGGLEGRPITQERMSGYLAVMEETGHQPVVLTGRSARSFGREMAFRLTAEHPEVTAALCFNDLVALGLLSGFAEQGRVVGRDFRIVGFDDIEECAQVFPQLSSVRCNIAGFGCDTAAALLDWLISGTPPPPVRRAPVSLVVRASSAATPSAG